MSDAVYSEKEERKLSCGFCGKSLRGFYFTCHVCGATYCYAHRPERCKHTRAQKLEVEA